MNPNTKYVIGVDFGSDTVRAIVADSASGQVISSGITAYPRWKQGLYQHPGQAIFRQHPKDYLTSLEESIKTALAPLSNAQISAVCGIGVDTTGSTPAPVDRLGIPLALKPEFEDCEDAMFHLWKDHSAQSEAEELDKLFRTGSPIDYTRHQGKYCSEWFWAKILRAIRRNDALRDAAYTWVEHCDWMVGLLTGNTNPDTMYHSACAAGHKALWHSDWNGFPADEVLAQADPYLCQVKARFGRAPEDAMVCAGTLCQEWAETLGLPAGIAVSGSSFDAHAGAVGAGVKPRTMVCTIGTSAVDMVVETAGNLEGTDIGRFGGKAENSILPGYVGIETGQAAFGDIFAWFKRLMMWPIQQASALLPQEIHESLCQQMEDQMLSMLQTQAQQLPLEDFPIALDWFNGRRYPDTDDFQNSAISGLTLGTSAPAIYRALVFGAVCGLRRIVDGIRSAGILVEDLVAVGGISKKSDYIMQMMADMLKADVSILDADQTCAIGAAMYAAVAAGIYPGADEATAHMAASRTCTFHPDPEKTSFYDTQYARYLKLADLKAELK